ATPRRMGFPVLAFAVPVRPATDPESQPLGDAREPLLDPGRMTGVPDLDAVQSLVLKDAELRLGAVIAQMRRDGQPPHLVHERGDLAEPRQRLLDVRSAATTQVAAECVADVVARARVDERSRDVRPSQRPPI